MRSDQKPPPPGGPRCGQPGRPTREWSGRLAQTRGQDRQDYVQHGRGRPSVGETPANTVDVFLASAAPPARDSGCPPNRVNPTQCRESVSPTPERVRKAEASRQTSEVGAVCRKAARTVLCGLRLASASNSAAGDGSRGKA